MARPTKKGLDYFPHDANASQDRAIRYIESKHGLVGYAIYFKLLEKVFGVEGHFLHWKPVDESIYSAEWGVEVEFLRNLLDDFFEIGLFSKWVYDANQVLTSPGIQKRYHEAVKKRPKYNGIVSFCLINQPECVVNSAETPLESKNRAVNSELSTQSKVKESKGKKSKEEVAPLTPQQERLLEYCQSMKPKIIERFPHALSCFDIEVDKCVAFNCKKNLGADPSLTVWRWFERVKKPDAFTYTGGPMFTDLYGGGA